MVALLMVTAGLAGSLSGVVVDEETSAPLSGATVYAYDLRLAAVSTTTDSDGAFVLDGLDGGPYRLLAYPHYTDNHATRIYPEGIDYCAGELLWPDGAPVTFALPEGATLTGQLSDPDGSPLSGATVTARNADLFPRATLTDSDGSFEVVGLEAAEWTCDVSLEGLPDQYLGEVYDDEDALLFSVAAQSTADVGSHTMLPGITVEGGVYGPDDVAEEGTNVVVYANSQITTVQTDADGRYTATGLPTGAVLPWSEPAGLALTYYPDVDRPTSFIDALDEGMVLSDADLFPPIEATLTVTLLDADSGDPVEGAGVMLYNSTQSVAKGGSAGEEGQAEIRGLHGGEYMLYIFAADEGFTDGFYEDDSGETEMVVVEAEADSSLTIHLTPAVTLSGTVLGDDGTPIYGATVLALSDDDSDSTTTDAEGSYSLTGLPPGDWEVMVSYGGVCDQDPGWVTTYYPGTVNGSLVEPVAADEGDAVDGLDLTMPCDNDHDSMGDAWERRWGLDVGRDDSLEDLDGDGLNNLYEYRSGSNPASAGRRGGCGSRAGLIVLLPLLGWRTRR